MDAASFSSIFAKALTTRNEFLPQMPPWFGGASASWPPVVGFGLPRDGVALPVVTVGLNPSNREIESGHISGSTDHAKQWEQQCGYFARGQLDWFNKSDAFLRAALGRIHRDGIPHLDVSPQPTAGGFDSIYDKKASPEEKSVALRFLARGITENLLPLLELLVAENALAKVVVYGYLPAPKKSDQGGSATLKDLFWNCERPFVLREVDSASEMRIGRGKLRGDHPWTRSRARLQSLDFVFLARGPSAQRGPGELMAAGDRVRALGWL